MNTVPLVDETEPAFRFDELSPEAQQNAIEKYAEEHGAYDDWYESIYEWADQLASIMGFEINRTTTVFRGRKSVSLHIYFSGFWVQGQGAHFTGSWHMPKDPYQMFCNVLSETSDPQIHEIAFTLADVANRSIKLGWTVKAEITSRTMSGHNVTVATEFARPDEYHGWPEFVQLAAAALAKKSGFPDTEPFEDELYFEAPHCPVASEIDSAVEDFMSWIFQQLRDEYDYLTGPECAREHLSCSDELFDSEGNPL